MGIKPKFEPQYITDAEGHRKAVILTIEEFEELLENLDTWQSLLSAGMNQGFLIRRSRKS